MPISLSEAGAPVTVTLKGKVQEGAGGYTFPDFDAEFTYNVISFTPQPEPVIVEGRPLIIDGKPRLAATCPSDAANGWNATSAGAAAPAPYFAPAAAFDDALDRAAPAPTMPASAAVRSALGERWCRAAANEHASVASFSKHALELMSLGAPAALLAV